MLGAAMGLLDAKALDHLAGRVAFLAVPAEEYGDIEWRVAQARAESRFLGGKPELLRLGHFDDVDLAMMIHTTPRVEKSKAGVRIEQRLHRQDGALRRPGLRGGALHMGINALYAAQIGLMAINAIRETFRDEDTIRVHPIITHGGSQVNVIPGEVRIETYVRGRTMQAILDANVKVDRALRAGALALGATVEIETIPGYMPMTCDPIMTRHFKDIAGGLFGEEHYRQNRPSDGLDGHGRSLPGHAHPAPLYRRRRGTGRRRLRHRRQAARVPGPRQGARGDGGRHALGRRRRRPRVWPRPDPHDAREVTSRPSVVSPGARPTRQAPPTGVSGSA